MTGKDYADRIAAHIVRNYSDRGIKVYREVSLGKTIIGKNRRIDLLMIHHDSGAAFAVECKYQDNAGTTDEKIPYAIRDLQAIGLPGCLAYAGTGFSEGILHMLEGCPIAARCMPSESLERTKDTHEFDIAVALVFRWWDVVVRNIEPFSLPDGNLR